MSRVQCTDCGIPVVVDPTGLCPEGHYLGTPGQRIDDLIGSDSPHPEEPEPWVGHIGVLEAVDPVEETPRRIRPPAVAALEGDEPAAEPTDLLRELHTMEAPSARPTGAGGHEHHGRAAAAGAPLPAEDRARGDEADTAAALEVAMHAMSSSGNGHTRADEAVSPPAARDRVAAAAAPASPSTAGAIDHLDALDELDALFADVPGADTDAGSGARPAAGAGADAGAGAAGDAGARAAGAAPPPPPPPGGNVRSAALADMAALAQEDAADTPDALAGDGPDAGQQPPASAARAADEDGGDSRRPSLDIGNFTAQGARVGSEGRGRRRRG